MKVLSVGNPPRQLWSVLTVMVKLQQIHYYQSKDIAKQRSFQQNWSATMKQETNYWSNSKSLNENYFSIFINVDDLFDWSRQTIIFAQNRFSSNYQWKLSTEISSIHHRTYKKITVLRTNDFSSFTSCNECHEGAFYDSAISDDVWKFHITVVFLLIIKISMIL